MYALHLTMIGIKRSRIKGGKVSQKYEKKKETQLAKEGKT